MPITAFNSFTDGLDPSRRSREHFVTSIDMDDDRKFSRAKYLPKSRGSSSRLGSLLPTQMASGNIPEASQGNDIAERMLGKILGDEEEKQEVEAPWALVGAEAFAAAVEPP